MIALSRKPSGDAAAPRTRGASSEIGSLISACSSGDTAAFERLYGLTSSRVYGIVLSVVRDPARADDVTQDVFVQIWRQADRCDPSVGSPMGWIVSIAHRRAVDCVRSEVARRARDDVYCHRVDVSSSDGPEEVAISGLDRDHILAAVAALSHRQATLIRLAFFEGHTHSQLSAATGTPLGTVKASIRDGLRMLTRTLAEYDLTRA